MWSMWPALLAILHIFTPLVLLPQRQRIALRHHSPLDVGVKGKGDVAVAVEFPGIAVELLGASRVRCALCSSSS
ncbi:hypothetical protein B0H16DRAFT_1560451 [Mycena metata]|uniref:Secreted protein n=1 Tax=Mycena metata TaxID=1033252 RepID=A0AAD7IIX5_9AGAR|nr:hypothetical protein B0H16DRAFT_1560451 [Mycena metata]